MGMLDMHEQFTSIGITIGIATGRAFGDWAGGKIWGILGINGE